jgi:hypothetical protein
MAAKYFIKSIYLSIYLSNNEVTKTVEMVPKFA